MNTDMKEDMKWQVPAKHEDVAEDNMKNLR